MSILSIIWSRWKIIARHIGVFQSRLILSVFYFTLLLPIGLVFSLFHDKLEIKKPLKSYWKAKTKQPETVEEMRRQS